MGSNISKGKSLINISKKGFRINSLTYCDILKNNLLPFLDENRTYYFLRDNARYHTSVKTKTYLEEKGINVINVIKNYPPYSPDFNAIEIIWKILNIIELEEAIKNSLEEISLGQINNPKASQLIRSTDNISR